MSILQDLDPAYAKIQSGKAPTASPLRWFLALLLLVAGAAAIYFKFSPNGLKPIPDTQPALPVKMADAIPEHNTSTGDDNPPSLAPNAKAGATIQTMPTPPANNPAPADAVAGNTAPTERPAPTAKLATPANAARPPAPSQSGAATKTPAAKPATADSKIAAASRKTNRPPTTANRGNATTKKQGERDVEIITAIMR